MVGQRNNFRIFAAKYKTMVRNTKHLLNEIGALIELSSFIPEEGVAEFHAIIHVQSRGEVFAQQYSRIKQAEAALSAMPELANSKPVFKRYFLSDATNQAPVMGEDSSCAVSYIQQAPLDGSKVALWIYLQRGTEVETEGKTTVVTHNGYKHLWTMGIYSNVDNSYMQTWKTLFEYIDILKQHDATLKDNCVRTWFFVRDVDTQYGGLVKARRECFIEQGLTPNTHYISSTGIGGNPVDPKALVQLGAYAMTGFDPEQQHYLYALTHLNKTIEYGVTFERGTLFEYGDRGHIFISGTASINNKGEVMHVGDIVNQTKRMWENVGELLKEGGMGYDDVMQIIVYLRDTADYDIVSRMFEERFPNVPYVITLAPVCRPTWLIEMECIAVQKRQTDFRNF